MGLIESFRRLIGPLEARLRGMVATGIIRKVDDTKGVQEVQVSLLKGELRSGRRVQAYGFSSVPYEGSEAVVVFPGGDRSHAIVIAADDRSRRRKSLDPGDVSVYVDVGTFLWLDASSSHAHLEGDEVTLSGASKITLEVGSSSIVIDASGVTIKGAAINLDP